MWKHSDLLHPATVLSAAALFVSLGGVTYAAATIGTKDLKTGAVTRAKISNRAVSPSKLATGAVTTEKLATGAVTPTKLRAGAITAGKLADGAIQSSNLQDGAVTAEKVGSGAVTAAKLGAGAVGAAAIADGAVGREKLAAGAAVAGRGSILTFRVAVPAGGTPTTLLTLPGFGTLSATCTSGRASSKVENTTTKTLDTRVAITTNGVAPQLDVESLTPGTALTASNTTGSEVHAWQLTSADADGTVRLATIDLTARQGCTVFGQAVTTG